MKILCVLYSQTEGGREKRKLLHFKQTHNKIYIHKTNTHFSPLSLHHAFNNFFTVRSSLSLYGVFSLSHSLYDTHNTHSFTLHNFSFLFSTVSYQFSSGGNPFFYAIVDFFIFFLFPFRFFS
jgi:hypothetical protein